jgi:C_GCAxxG_C_C family probable redox protein
MGHCAPAATKTILEAADAGSDRLVRLTSGLPGGIGNTGFECGGITGALVSLGVRYGSAVHDGLPVVVWKGRDYCRRFLACHGSLLCREIRADARLPLRCIRVVRRAAELQAQAVASDDRSAIAAGAGEAYRRFLAHLASRRFHCAHAVLEALRGRVPVDRQLLDAASPFVGGTILEGLTCSALTAGVMAVGLEAGAIENSYPRVLRMVALMVVGGRALDDDVNAFNRAVKLGYRLARWFRSVFGSTQCRALTGCDLSSEPEVERFIADGRLARCEAVAAAVAWRAGAMLARARAGPHRPATAATAPA